MPFFSSHSRCARVRKVAAVLALAALAAPAWGAISLDSPVVFQRDATGTNTQSFTVGTGSDRVLVVALVVTALNTMDSVTSVTWNGVALSQELQTQYSNTVYQDAELWYLVGPSAGATAAVTVTFATANNNVVGALEYAGVDPFTPFGAENSSTAASSPLATTVTTQFTGSRLLFNCGNYNSNTGAYTLDANYTDRWQGRTGGTLGLFADRSVGPPGAYSGTNSYTDTVTDTVIQQLVELVPLQPTATMTATPTATATATASPTAAATLTATRTVTTEAPATATPEAAGTDFVSPNPFFPDRPPLDWVHFALPAGHGEVHLSILDLDLRVRWSGEFGPGSAVEWNGRDQEGAGLHSGAYLWLLEESGQASRKGSLVLAR